MIEIGGRAGPELCVGRSAEAAEVLLALEAPAGGRSSVVVVEGDAGMGKTTLIDTVLDRARPGPVASLPVYRGGGHPMEARRTFGLLSEAFAITADAGGLRAEIARLVSPAAPASWSTDPSWMAESEALGLEFRLGELFVALLDEATTSGPIVLVLEDLHWADPASLIALRTAAGAELSAPMAVVATCRPVPRPPALVSLLSTWSQREALTLRLGALGPEACQDLVAALTGAAPAPELAAMVGGAGGNPLFLTEAVRALAHDGLITVEADGLAHAPAGGWPANVSLAILSRLATLSPKALDLLRLATVLGMRFRLADLADLAGLSSAACWDRLADAHRAGLLVDAGEALAFHHEMVRDALYHDLPLAVRAGLHHDAAVALSRSGAPATAVAEHVLLSDRRGDPDSLRWLREAARLQLGAAPTVAIELLETARALVGPGTPDHLAILAELGTALIGGGRNPEGEVLLREVIGGTTLDGAEQDGLRARLLSSLLVRGEAARAAADADAALASSRPSPAARDRLRAFRAQAAVLTGDLDTADALAMEAHAGSRAAGDMAVQAQALSLRCHIALRRGQVVEAVEFGAAAVGLAAEADTSEAHEGLPGLFHVLALIDADRIDEAAEASEAARRSMERFGTGASLTIAHLAISHWQLRAGRWDDALVEVATAAALAERTGWGWIAELWCARGLIACWRGQLDDAGQVVAELDRRGVTSGAFYAGLPDQFRATVCDAMGDSAGALRAYSQAWELAGGPGGMPLEQREIGPHLARLAAAAGQDDLTHRVADTLDVLADRGGRPPSLAAAALRSRGLADGDPARVAEAVELYRVGMRPLDAARCAEEAAVLWARAGRVGQAAPLAREALTGYQALAAAGEVSRGRAALRAAGVRVGSRGPRARPRFGWAALTDTEVAVAHLVAAGRSNPEIARELFLSRHTVVAHVSHVLAKLGISSRTELVAAAARGGLEQLGE